MARKKVVPVSDETQEDQDLSTEGQEDEVEEVQDETIQNLTPGEITLNHGGKSVTIPAATLKGNGSVDAPGSAVVPASILTGLEGSAYFEALLTENRLKRG